MSLSVRRFPPHLGGGFYIFHDLAPGFGLQSNYEVENQIKEVLIRRDPALLSRLTFDTERDTFSCSGSEEDLIDLLELIMSLHP